MTKFALLVLIAGVAIGYFSNAESLGAPDAEEGQERYGGVQENDEENDRSGARAHAHISIVPAPFPGPSPPLIKTVECYACTDCPKIFPNTTSKVCPYTYDSKQKSCIVYAEQYKHLKRSWYVRGCASERGSCADITESHSGHGDIVKLQFCKECVGDRCNKNGANRSVSEVTIALIALVFTPLIGKYTLS